MAVSISDVRRLMEAREYERAIEALAEQLPSLRAAQSRGELLEALLFLGICHYEHNNLDAAGRVLKEGLKLSRDIGAPITGFAQELSLVRREEGRVEEAIALCKESLELDLEAGGDGALQLHTLAILYQDTKQFDEALKALALVKESCEARRDYLALGRCLHEMGLTCMVSGDMPSAVKHMVDSIALKHRIGEERGLQVTRSALQALLKSDFSLVMDPAIQSDLKRLQGLPS